jgi:hypothetical protein
MYWLRCIIALAMCICFLQCPVTCVVHSDTTTCTVCVGRNDWTFNSIAPTIKSYKRKSSMEEFCIIVQHRDKPSPLCLLGCILSFLLVSSCFHFCLVDLFFLLFFLFTLNLCLYFFFVSLKYNQKGLAPPVSSKKNNWTMKYYQQLALKYNTCKMFLAYMSALY